MDDPVFNMNITIGNECIIDKYGFQAAFRESDNKVIARIGSILNGSVPEV